MKKLITFIFLLFSLTLLAQDDNYYYQPNNDSNISYSTQTYQNSQINYENDEGDYYYTNLFRRYYWGLNYYTWDDQYYYNYYYYPHYWRWSWGYWGWDWNMSYNWRWNYSTPYYGGYCSYNHYGYNHGYVYNNNYHPHHREERYNESHRFNQEHYYSPQRENRQVEIHNQQPRQEFHQDRQPRQEFHQSIPQREFHSNPGGSHGGAFHGGRH